MLKPSSAQSILEETSLIVRETFRAVLGGGNIAASSSSSSFREPSLDVDVKVVCVLSAMLFALNKTIKVMLVEPIARKALTRDATKTKSSSSKKEKRRMKKACQKFSQSALEALIYLCFFLVGMRIVRTQAWFWPSRNWWKDQTSDSRTQADFRGYYLLYVARYVAEIISVGLEYDRKDKREMLLHHFLSLIHI